MSEKVDILRIYLTKTYVPTVENSVENVYNWLYIHDLCPISLSFQQNILSKSEFYGKIWESINSKCNGSCKAC